MISDITYSPYCSREYPVQSNCLLDDAIDTDGTDHVNISLDDQRLLNVWFRILSVFHNLYLPVHGSNYCTLMNQVLIVFDVILNDFNSELGEL